MVIYDTVTPSKEPALNILACPKLIPAHPCRYIFGSCLYSGAFQSHSLNMHPLLMVHAHKEMEEELYFYSKAKKCTKE
jgi:hypothetical protein